MTDNQEVPYLMGQMLGEESYTALCEAVERVNYTPLLFTPDDHLLFDEKDSGALYYSVSGKVHAGNSSTEVNGTYVIEYSVSDTIHSVAGRIAAQMTECEAQAEDNIRDGVEYRDTLEDLSYHFNHSR